MTRRRILHLLNIMGRLAGGGGFAGAYDAIPSIVAAYGMRRLLTSYTGNLLRLRRSSDNAEQDFGYVANGDLDVAAIATFIGGGSGYVVTWYDQSGNGNNATQSTAANQPLYVSQAVGMTFDASNDVLITPVIALLNMSYVIRFSGASNAGSLFGSRVSGLDGVYLKANDGSSDRRYQAGNAVNIAGALTSGVMGIANKQPYLNGATDGSVIGAGSVTGVALHIGALNTGGTPGQFSNLSTREMVIASVTYTAPQMATINTIMG